ncbi:MAG: hypothetical protein ABI167_00745 [Nitrosospira sp.]
METSDLPRHQLIKSLMAQPTEKVADAAIRLWEQMATQLISIVGEDGFNSLYARSLFLAQSTFPWLATGPLAPQSDHRFAGLKTNLEAQTPALAHEATTLLLITFTDILSSLMGEQLTTHILELAWGIDPLNVIGKEPQK